MIDVKQRFILVVVLVVLLLSAYNIMKDKHEFMQHEEFFKEMLEFKRSTEDFKSHGARNTAEQGEKRDLSILSNCQRLNILEFHLKEDVELTDCDAIYAKQ